jgi:hypothetical protein
MGARSATEAFSPSRKKKTPMTFTEAAAEVLRLLGRPLHYKEITDYAIEKNLLSHVGKSPEVTMGARLAALMKKESPDTPLVRVKPGVFALREWDPATIKAGLEGKRAKKGRSDESAAPVDESAGAEAEELDAEPAAQAEDDDDEVLIPVRSAEAPARREPPPPPPRREPRPAVRIDDEALPPAGPEDRMRAELAAGAAEVFGEEDDDDEPILGGTEEPRAGETGDGRRRRRRRRRGRGSAEGGAVLPAYTATPVDAQAPAPQVREPREAREPREGRDRGDRDGRDRDRDRDSRDRDRVQHGPDLLGEGSPAGDDLAGRDFADFVAQLVGTFDRNAGPVSLRQIAESGQRRGKLSGDLQALSSMVAAAVRADNLRRQAAGQRVRFRFTGGRVALTDWLLGNELASAEADAIAAVERYREVSRRVLAKKIAELPGHAFIELSVLALERIGVRELRAVRRPGAPGGEAHFGAVMKTPGGDVRVALLIRRDGREVGRERVTELRGALHHYGPATMGWILTAGQVLSGAREEADIAGVAPVALTDGGGLARLCEDHDVAVQRTRMHIAIPDVDLLDALRAS